MKKMIEIRDLMMVKVIRPCERISLKDMMEALKLMNTGKTAVPSGVTVDMLKVCADECFKRLTKVANTNLQRERRCKIMCKLHKLKTMGAWHECY